MPSPSIQPAITPNQHSGPLLILSPHFTNIVKYVLVTDIQSDRVAWYGAHHPSRTRTLVADSQPQPVQAGQSTESSTRSEASQQVLLEALPPVLVLYLERFLYDAAADGTKKVNKARSVRA